MKLLVAICTYNRAHLLRETLSCMAQLQRPPDADLRFIVVNNCCTDDTDVVAASFQTNLPLTVVHEPKPGLSNARNRAIDEAAAWGADYIIWTDDDVRPQSDWLLAYADACVRHPGVAVLGGLVDPWFETEPPNWISDNWQQLRFAFAVRDLGPDAHRLDPDKGLPFGANFAIRVQDQLRHRYDPRLGVVKGRRLGGEETMVMKAILAQDNFGWWLPQARVRHFIERDRLTVAYITRYFIGAGASASMSQTDTSARLMGRPRWLFGQALRQTGLLAWDLLTWRRSNWVVRYTELLFTLGRLREPTANAAAG
jgi:glycosyltransferase involved in cell wall biosynthesis